MRCCYYILKPRSNLSSYIAVIPHVASPPGLRAQLEAQISEIDITQDTRSTQNLFLTGTADGHDATSTAESYAATSTADGHGATSTADGHGATSTADCGATSTAHYGATPMAESIRTLFSSFNELMRSIKSTPSREHQPVPKSPEQNNNFLDQSHHPCRQDSAETLNKCPSEEGKESQGYSGTMPGIRSGIYGHPQILNPPESVESPPATVYSEATGQTFNQRPPARDIDHSVPTLTREESAHISLGHASSSLDPQKEKHDWQRDHIAVMHSTDTLASVESNPYQRSQRLTYSPGYTPSHLRTKATTASQMYESSAAKFPQESQHFSSLEEIAFGHTSPISELNGYQKTFASSAKARQRHNPPCESRERTATLHSTQTTNLSKEVSGHASVIDESPVYGASQRALRPHKAPKSTRVPNKKPRPPRKSLQQIIAELRQNLGDSFLASHPITEKAPMKRSAELIELTLPPQRPRMEMDDNGTSRESPFAAADEVIYVSDDSMEGPSEGGPSKCLPGQLPFLTSLRKFAQALAKCGEGGTRPVTRRGFYHLYQDLIKSPEFEYFKQTLSKFHAAFAAQRFRKEYFEKAGDFYLPIWRRVKRWSVFATKDESVEKAERNYMYLDDQTRRTTFFDMVDAFLCFCFYDASKEGHQLIEDILVSETSDVELKTLKEGLNRLLLAAQQATGTFREVNVEDLDIKPLVLCSLIYSIVQKNFDPHSSGPWSLSPMSQEFAALISLQLKICLLSQTSITMTSKDPKRLREEYEKLLSTNNESVGQHIPKYQTNFQLERIAPFFTSNVTWSLGSPNRVVVLSKLVNAIAESQDELVKDWRDKIERMNNLMNSLRPGNNGGAKPWLSWEYNLLLVLRRYQAWLEGLLSKELASKQYQLFNTKYSRLRECTAGVSLLLRALSFPEEVKELELLLSEVPSMVYMCRRGQGRVAGLFRSRTIEEILGGLKSRAARELLLSSLFYSVLSKSLNIRSAEFYDYKSLEEEDISALRKQVSKFLKSQDSNEDDLILPPEEQARIRTRLRADIS